ncbi:MAG: hypothetical protein CVV44_11510 [Spirochaetae bacterium HGW-Spirochaetae-1]|jgi:vacuolar-type H+-ATPase subunit E/Vma4|nr:MAG: hypothetical protein CVV44_11510 [Spirochaetae bacterium HGW-Spirochaetae-1]
MNSLSEKIVTEAREKAREIARGGETAVVERRDALQQEYDNQAAQAQEKLDALYRAEYNRVRSIHNLELKKMALRQKRAVIGEVLMDLARELKDNRETYRRFMERVVIKGVQTGREEIIVSSDDEVLFTQDVLERLNSEAGAVISKVSEITLSRENRETGGGLYLREGKREFNATVDAAVQVMADRYQIDIISMLFS